MPGVDQGSALDFIFWDSQSHSRFISPVEGYKSSTLLSLSLLLFISSSSLLKSNPLSSVHLSLEVYAWRTTLNSKPILTFLRSPVAFTSRSPFPLPPRLLFHQSHFTFHGSIHLTLRKHVGSTLYRCEQAGATRLLRPESPGLPSDGTSGFHGRTRSSLESKGIGGKILLSGEPFLSRILKVSLSFVLPRVSLVSHRTDSIPFPYRS